MPNAIKGAQRQLRILVVDDNTDQVVSTLSLLAVLGYQAKGCYNGQQALECIKEYDPDVVLMDIRMPGMSGWEAGKRIRDVAGDKKILLIGISGEYATKGADNMLAKLNGFDHYLTKPADPGTLVKLLADADPG